MDFSDTGAIVLGWLTRVSVALGLIGVIAFDVISLGVTSLSVTDDAQAAARSAASAYAETKNVDRAYEAAADTLAKQNANDVVSAGTFAVSPEGRVSLTVEREAVTIVARYIPSIKDQLVLHADGEAVHS
jgi:hypothetical protein